MKGTKEVGESASPMAQGDSQAFASGGLGPAGPEARLGDSVELPTAVPTMLVSLSGYLCSLGTVTLWTAHQAHNALAAQGYSMLCPQGECSEALQPEFPGDVGSHGLLFNGHHQVLPDFKLRSLAGFRPLHLP